MGIGVDKGVGIGDPATRARERGQRMREEWEFVEVGTRRQEPTRFSTRLGVLHGRLKSTNACGTERLFEINKKPAS